ncbi:MAG: hypothetical protein M9904_11890 [Chitinophagaceae bacterium]|nr:hypothetical protein [Chitinophagaceae bacterium]
MINNSFHPHVWFRNSGDIFERNIVMKKYAPIQVNKLGSRINNNLFPDTTALHDAQSRRTDPNSIAGGSSVCKPCEWNYTVASTRPHLHWALKTSR